MTKKVLVYTQPDCPPCKIVKQFLDHHHVMFEEIDITKDEKARDHLINVLQSYSTPTVTVDEVAVKGFDLPALEKLVL
ncbi:MULTISPECIES: glutaredoxin domain-containing protein [Bacillaceae]|uniref:Glutaredoxin domain-containing protein n=1 Tax=Metabacillus sediminis TaxID=3117746 RepID=A0ABZ2NKS9_9BACI|nr:glutaredoxin domain-containing protein [Bacillus sp. SJS]KZZ85271.1 NrdH-redoxin [Bacillus sp. SJS]